MLDATADTELSPALIPFYTQMSGTSMATPFTAGVVALMLDADPTLTPDEIKQILIDTATRMPGYADHEVGAGYLNAHAAVDKVFNRNKAYASRQEASFNAVLTRDNIPAQNFHIDFDPTVNGTASTNARPFTVEPNVSVLKARATVDLVSEPGATNVVGLRLWAPDGTVYSPTFALNSTSNVREGIVNDPIPGTWYVEARGTARYVGRTGYCHHSKWRLPGRLTEGSRRRDTFCRRSRIFRDTHLRQRSRLQFADA